MFYLIFLIIFTKEKVFELTTNHYNLPGSEWDEFWISYGYIWDRSLRTNEVVYLRLTKTVELYSYFMFTAWDFESTHLRMDLPIDIYIDVELDEELSKPEKFKSGMGGFRKLNDEKYFAIVARAFLTIKLQHSFCKQDIMGNEIIFK
jgi:hypothetical protein